MEKSEVVRETFFKPLGRKGKLVLKAHKIISPRPII